MDRNTVSFGMYLWFIIVVIIISIIGFMSISYSAEMEKEILQAAQTIGVILFIISGILLAIIGYQNLVSHESPYDILSSEHHRRV